MTYLLIAEKPSAAKSFAKALGGTSGTFNGQAFKIVALVGHMLEFVEPHEMVDPSLSVTFKSWDPESMPWDVSQMAWKKRAQVTKNSRTGKSSSKQKGITAVKDAAKGCSAIVIATDKDPSGEGQLIGWEVIQAIGWKGDVKRLYFTDESEKELQKGFKNIVDLPHWDKDGEYVKAHVRERWDFVSMQLTRLATTAARKQGYNAVVRQGRLKSVMTKLVADQLARVNAYKKVPYFEVKYKDELGTTFSRKFEDGDAWRFAAKADGEKDAKQYGPSAVVQDSKERKETAPGKLLDLGGLASILGAKGYKSKEVLKTYQAMYEAKIVSYPRTEDKVISKEQFQEMLPLVDKIAGVVGADTSLLTHRTPRKTHVKDGGAHGANRPGVVVPSSLDSLSQYGASAKAIYALLATNFLAMFGENYVYDQIKAHIKDHPAFTATISVPVDMGFKAIFDADKESSDGDDEGENKNAKGIGTKGSPVVVEGVNKKPPYPTHKWLEKQLARYDVGTGATRVNTLSEITNGKSALLVDTKGKLSMTQVGDIAAVLLHGSHIGDPGVTEKLFKAMKDVGDFKMKPHKVLETVTSIVTHDKEVFYRNAQKLKAKVGAPSGDLAKAPQKPKATGVHAPTGQIVTFNRVWSGCKFTDEQVEQLLAGKTITIDAVSAKTGKVKKVEGALGGGTFKGKPYWGFQRKDASAYTGATAPFPAEWSGYKFTKADEAALRKGQKINIQAISAKTKKPYNADVTFEITEFQGMKDWRIKPHFEEKVDPDSFTRLDAPFTPEFSGYKLTDEEVAQVRAGHQIMVTAKSKKTGKDFTCNLSLEKKTFKGNKRWGLEAHFK